MREFEPSNYRIAGIMVHPDNNNVIVSCTESGELDFWNCQSGIITKKLVRFSNKLNISLCLYEIVERNTVYTYIFISLVILQQLKSVTDNKAKIKTFHITKYRTFQGNEICQALITYLSNCGNKIYILLFDIENGTCMKSIYIL